MYCRFCGKEIDEKAELCVHCGRRVRSSLAVFLENNELTRLRPIDDPKSPGLAAFLGFMLSFLCAGPFGYVYLGQWSWFWFTALIAIVAYVFTLFVPAYVIFPFVFAFHQYQMAKDLNAAHESTRKGESNPAKG